MEIDITAYYEQYGPMVLRRCRFLLKDEERALDAMQEVFVKLLESQHQLEGTYPSSLLYRIATNVCLNMIRSKSRSRTDYNPDLVDAAAGHDDVAGRTEAHDFLERIFAAEEAGSGTTRGRSAAPVSTREIAVMYYLDSMTYEEVARETGLSVSGIRKRLRNLKQKAIQLEGVEEHA